MLKKIEALLIFIILGAIAFAAPKFGLGGPYPTDNEGLDTLLVNPAAIRSAENDFEFLNVTAHLQGPVVTLAELASGAVSEGKEITDILASAEMQDILNGLYLGIDLDGPLNFGYIGKNIGFGLFNSTSFIAEETGPIALSMSLTEDVMFAGGYSFRIPLSKDEKSVLDLGVVVKAGLSGEVSIEKSFLELPGMFDNPGLDLIMGQPFELSKILSADAGLLYSWDEQFSVGVSVQDFYSIVYKDSYVNGVNGFLNSEAPSSEIGMLPLEMNAGIEYDPELKFLKKLFTDFRIMAGYDDVLDFLLYPSEAENWILHLHTGVELSLFNVFDFRVGLAEGLLNAGLGLDFKIIKIDAAVFGTERASQPNTSPVYNIALGFTI